MQVLHRVSGRVAGIPYSKNVVDLNTGDVTQMVDAATGLVKAVGGVALVGAVVLGGIGIIAAILHALMSGLKPANQTNASAGTPSQPASPIVPPQPLVVVPPPLLALGSAPVWIETPGSKFWGIILNNSIEFGIRRQGYGGSPFDVKFSDIAMLSSDHDDGSLNIKLVDGSEYSRIYPVSKVNPRPPGGMLIPSLEIAVLGGLRSIPLWEYQQYYERSLWRRRLNTRIHYMDAKLIPSTVNDVNALRGNLQQALTQNGAAITQLIGPGILQTYFNVSKI